MDELVIGEKKYISSKQAAKATGYAKDYIGQLCREGRVPARLVGRSWYVLESAIHDHRFGDPKTASVSEKGENERIWESPRYTAADTEILPSVNRLKNEKPVSSSREEEGKISQQRLQDTWQAWFDAFESSASTSADIGPTAEEETVVKEEMDTPVPIHAIHHSQYQPLPPFEPELQQLYVEVEQDQRQGQDISKKSPRRGVRGVFRTIKIATGLCALCMVILAAFGSGYLDTYIVSNSTVRMIAGVVLYQK